MQIVKFIFAIGSSQEENGELMFVIRIFFNKKSVFLQNNTKDVKQNTSL